MVKEYNEYIFKGYCCHFNIDRYGDKFLPKSFIFNTQHIPILYEHKEKIGLITLIKEDNYGLYVEFKLLKNILNIKNNLNDFKLSIGFKCINFYKKKSIRYIKKALILEISIVKNPAQYNTFFY